MIDNLERAVAHADRRGNGGVDGAAVLKGVDLVLRLFKQKLERYEVRPFEATGQPFDPRVHEAISRVEHAGDPGRLGRGRAAEGLPRRRAPAAAGAGLGVVGQRQADRAVGGLAACRPITTKRWASAAARPTSRSRSPTGSSRSGGTRIATPATRRPRSGSRSWRSRTRCCPTTASAGTTIASARSTARARSAAADVTGATEFFDALFGDLFGLQRGASRPRGATCATRWSSTSRRRRWGARRCSSSSAPRTARRARARAPRAATRGWSPARAAAARA